MQVGDSTLFAKMDANLDSNAKIMKAGRLGREVFLFALRRNRVHGAKGWIPSLELEPWYLERVLWMPANEAEQGVTACVTSELIVVSPPKASIVGWGEQWGGFPKSSAERKQAQRDRDRVTKRHAPTVTKRDSHESHGSEKIRSEEKRSDQRRSQTAPVPVAGFKETVLAFDSAYEKATGSRPTWGPKEGAMLNRVLKPHGAAEVQRRIGEFFKPRDWPKGFDLGTFTAHFDKFTGVQASLGVGRSEPKKPEDYPEGDIPL